MSNLYEILCVKPTATIDEINEAYLDLLMTYGRIESPKNFVSKFKNLSEGHIDPKVAYKELDHAYSILADPVKRSEYNREYFKDVYDYEMALAETNRDYECCIRIRDPFQEYYDQNDEVNDSNSEIPYTIEEEDFRKTSCPTVCHDVVVPLKTAYENKWIEVGLTFTQRCTRCRGSGYEKNVKRIKCPECFGFSQTCSKCHGKGTIIPIGFICNHCRGKRVIEVLRTFEFKFEKGYHDDTEVIFESKGNETDVSKPGDVCFKLIIDPGDCWDVNDYDITYRCPISSIDTSKGELQFCLPDGQIQHATIEGEITDETFIKIEDKGLSLEPRTIPADSKETRGSLFVVFVNNEDSDDN